MEAKKIPLHHVHENLGARLIPFAGYLMPVRYSSDKEEHLAVRNNVGIFDVSHMGEFEVKGKDAANFLQQVTSNDIRKLVPGKAQYSCLPNLDGGIVDDLIVYMIGDNHYFLVVNASNIEKDWEWMSRFKAGDVQMENRSADFCLFAVQGPNAEKALQPLTDTDLSSIPFYNFRIGGFAGEQDVIISATGYTGAGGFELYLPSDKAENVWRRIMETGRNFNLLPVGLGARDTLRLEMGYCLYGNDIDDSTSPIEAGLGWITKLDTEFNGRDKIAALKEAGPDRKLVAFMMEERGIPRAGYTLHSENGEEIGRVTSGTMSPTLECGIGMGYVKTGFSKPDSPIRVSVRNKQLKAVVKKPPLVD